MITHGKTTVKSKVFSIDLFDEKSIGDAIKEYIGNRLDIQEAALEAVEALCAEGERKAKEEAPVDEGELRDSITHAVTVKNGKVEGTITASTDHAMFVEFGTGIVGASDPHPYNYLGWEYDVNGHGIDGWTYPKNGRFYHTLGQPSNPFMYRTAKYLTENAERILNEHHD